MRTFFYYAGIALLFTHELDAIKHAEWRLLFILKDLSDQSAYPIFLVLHLPVFYLFFWLDHHQNYTIRSRFRLLVALFLVAHAGIHLYNASAPQYNFHGLLSNALIYGAAISGVAYIMFSVLEREKSPN